MEIQEAANSADNQVSQEVVNKEEKIAEERRKLLDNVLAANINSEREKVAYILNNYPESRDSDKVLSWLYWEIYESDKFNGEYITKEQFTQLTKVTSIRRQRAKIQNEYNLFLANPTVRKFRGVLEEENRISAIEDRPSWPMYSVYIDETGKNQEYLAVGSLWVVDPKSAFFAYKRLKDWKKSKGINYEFHFSKVTRHKLNDFKEFFLEFLKEFPTIGFKVIIVKSSGIDNLQDAISDLTFHLINSGIEHEDSTGRAPLPRLLDVIIDDEEKGSDQLKLQNLKVRLASSIDREKLYLSKFIAVSSESNLYIQAVDIFIASINRLINSSNSSSKNHKDELAEYVLGLLSFDIKGIIENENILDRSTVFNLSYSNQ